MESLGLIKAHHFAIVQCVLRPNMLRFYGFTGNVRELAISPPDGGSETASLLSETECIPLHICCFVDK